MTRPIRAAAGQMLKVTSTFLYKGPPKGCGAIIIMIKSAGRSREQGKRQQGRGDGDVFVDDAERRRPNKEDSVNSEAPLLFFPESS